MVSKNNYKIKKESLEFPLYKVIKENLPENTYIYKSLAGEKIQFQPWVTGIELKQYARVCSTEFFTILRFLIPDFENIAANKFVEIVPLSGALYYQMAESFESIFNKSLPRVYLGAKRFKKENGWSADISYKNIGALPENPFIIVGDTIATGETLYATFEAIKDHIIGDPKCITIFSIAGAIPGITLMDKIRNNLFPNTPLYIILVNALFGLDENGTDMPWLHSDTIYPEDLHQKVLSNYGPFLGNRFCSIWDWGDRANTPLHHLLELKDVLEGYIKIAETELIKDKLMHFVNQTEQQITEATSSLGIMKGN